MTQIIRDTGRKTMNNIDVVKEIAIIYNQQVASTSSDNTIRIFTITIIILYYAFRLSYYRNCFFKWKLLCELLFVNSLFYILLFFVTINTLLFLYYFKIFNFMTNIFYYKLNCFKIFDL